MGADFLRNIFVAERLNIMQGLFRHLIPLYLMRMLYNHES